MPRPWGHRVAVDLTGFEGETREPDEISEVRRYVRAVSESFPYWFWFAVIEGPFLKLLLYCLCEIKSRGEVSGRHGQEYVRREI